MKNMNENREGVRKELGEGKDKQIKKREEEGGKT